MRKFFDVLLPIAATPGLLALLKLVGLYRLIPLGDWAFMTDAPAFLSVTGGALLSYFPIQSKKKRITIASLGLIPFFVTLFAYNWVATNPPDVESEWWYDILAYSTYFLNYFLFGFCASFIVRFFTQSEDGSAKPKEPLKKPRASRKKPADRKEDESSTADDSHDAPKS